MTECRNARELFDAHIDGEASGDSALLQHVAECPECGAVLAARKTLRLRLQAAVRAAQAPTGLEERIRRRREAPFLSRNMRPLMALAAAMVLAAGLTAGYQSGHFRYTQASQEAWISTLDARIAPIMRVGLNNHIHCAIFRKSAPASVESMVTDLGPKYRDLLPVVERHLPPGYKVVAGHICRYHGRPYVHLVMSDGAQRISLLITARAAGEGFENDLRAVASEAGVSFYSSDAGPYSTAGFETGDHLVYLVSDLDAARNEQTLRAMASDVDQTLRRIGI